MRCVNTVLQLAGDHLTVADTHDGTTIVAFDDKPTGRVCGNCTLCCRLVPVLELHKLAGARCVFQRFGRGCTIHASRPVSCRTWSCRWLADATTAGMPRPDRCHYVIDMMAGDMTFQQTGAPAPTSVPAVVVWVDPKFPDAHRAPELRAFLFRMAKDHGAPAIVRYDGRDALAIIAPPISSTGEWHEITAAAARDRLSREAHKSEAPG
jgi:hypothetical protein